MRLAVPGDGLGGEGVVADAAAAVARVVAVQEFRVGARRGDADAVVVARDRGEVAEDDEEVGGEGRCGRDARGPRGRLS